ncbi:MBL fold metallo-hydrolase [Paenibacillus sp. LHD-117]|uniref:MBL fold metallo-hydrolase n=1 Tax=Paenibacillus sp. LHD-117 TaxID=3071412 RepID=UPI0027E034D7|nr:MBL fold metallo-hydrolase [Paenibacillus sp. LHD-117]MDQ6419717.1 MBL fold metallo-hydrolase [Paenibacillus sp. LHD-117]
MRLGEGVWLVGSGQHGFEMSHTLDCSVYLVGDGDEYALIDAGGGVEPERIERKVEAAGVAMKYVTQLLLTHAHADHAAGAAYFRRAFGLRVIASEEAAPWVETADPVKTSIGPAIEAGVYPTNFVFPPCPVDETVREGSRIRIGRRTLRVIDTPGHARGHVSYFMEEADGARSLFSGDTVFAGGKTVLQNIWDCSIPDYAATLKKLRGLAIERMYPGHGPFLLSSASKHIEKALNHFRRLNIPPNL